MKMSTKKEKKQKEKDTIQVYSKFNISYNAFMKTCNDIINNKEK